MKLLKIKAKEVGGTDLSLNHRIEESLDSLAGQRGSAASDLAQDNQQRATQVTEVLEEILHNHGHAAPPPVHWGINE